MKLYALIIAAALTGCAAPQPQYVPVPLETGKYVNAQRELSCTFAPYCERLHNRALDWVAEARHVGVEYNVTMEKVNADKNRITLTATCKVENCNPAIAVAYFRRHVEGVK